MFKQELDLWTAISESIAEKTAAPFKIETRQAVAGGDINQAFRLSDQKNVYFVKLNSARLQSMFEAEFIGLEHLSNSHSIRVPEPLVVGEAEGQSYLVMEYINLGGSMPSRTFGEQMAALHQNENRQFGFSINNTIGSTPQNNNWQDNWVVFWQQRLGYQLDLLIAKASASLFDTGSRLIELVPRFFDSYQPRASLLHGDLWSGNYDVDEQGNPVIYDPACYYGDREADLAMMELFGHPGQTFFSAYDSCYPIDTGYRTRKNLYNLYHILNHANLFGAGYTGQATQMVKTLLSEVS